VIPDLGLQGLAENADSDYLYEVAAIYSGCAVVRMYTIHMASQQR